MFGFEDDPETLRAALELLDALDEPSQAQTHELSVSTEENESNRPAQKKHVVSSLTRQRQHVLELRKQVQQLEEELKAQRRSVKKRGFVSAIRRERQELWKAIAVRQRRAHERAEAQCIKLRTYVETRFRHDSEIAAALLAGTSSPNSAVPRPLMHQLSIEETFARLQDLNRHSHVAFAAERFNDGTPSFNEVQVMSDGQDGVIIDTRNAWVVPFPPEAVDQNLWQYMTRMHLMLPDPDYQADNQPSGDSIITSYYFPPKKEEPAYEAREVVKRFGRDGQARVTVATLHCETVDATDKAASSYEVWWMRLQVIQTDKNDRLTQVQSCRRTYIRSENPQVLRTSVEDIAGFLQVEGELRQSSVETLLLCAQVPSTE
ncbi:hypothetical protein Poli38472_004940 [Pythium oligandrum]|uniref:Uncharacterized protein n=1 Tax=Pythium oligandrum TaxID=41045 RepID=A0A8K1CAR9_PYTOL|nr:hypothetical protein Poli38472_004940 [Pythium oligandrum]|eukprot:TMW59871.1 hypothetical protein Poli38472_004940 [Pythium oligandrum]